MKFFFRALDYFNEICYLQRYKGIEHYGKGLDPQDKDVEGWMRAAEEELADAWMYLQAARERLRERRERDLRKLCEERQQGDLRD